MNQSDEEILAQHKAGVPLALEILKSIKPDPGYNGDILTITDPFVIAAAWGPRRLSNRRRGMDVKDYPERITAHRNMWVDWIERPRNFITIVIAKKRAQARIDAAMGNTSSESAVDPESWQSEPTAPITQEEIIDMLSEREELRAAKNFMAADRIRDYLIQHGVTVSDCRV